MSDVKLDNIKNIIINLKLALNKIEIEFNEYFKDNQIELNDETLKISGFAPKVSDILSNIKSSTESVEVIGVYKIEIDVDLTKDYMFGKNLSLVTNYLDVKGNRTINLSGLDPENEYCNPAYYGCEGSQGQSGNSGGNLFIHANSAPDLSNLKFVSNGSKGGDGQAGGQGDSATCPTPNTTVNTGWWSYWYNHDHYQQDDNYYDNDETTPKIKEYKDKYYHKIWNLHRLVFKPNAPSIERSKNGEKGGSSGLVGAKGSVKVIINQNPYEMKKECYDGQPGQPGRGGNPGRVGEVKVYKVYYLYRTPVNWQATVSIGFTNLWRNLRWIENNHIRTNYGQPGNQGTNGEIIQENIAPITQINYSLVIDKAKEFLEWYSNRLGKFGTLAINLKQQLYNFNENE